MKIMLAVTILVLGFSAGAKEKTAKSSSAPKVRKMAAVSGYGGTCVWYKKYSADHMKAHPTQTIQEIRGDYSFEAKTGNLIVTRKNNPSQLYNSAQGCWSLASDSYQCNFDEDGGAFSVTFNSSTGTLTLKLVSPVRLDPVKSTSNDPDPFAESVVISPTKGGDDTFLFTEAQGQFICSVKE